MSVEALTSNHVNYLVWRYLQEAGYGDAARQLSKEWNRSPETLPFAGDVRSHTLVNIIQDGLWVDQLQASVNQIGRRYTFGRGGPESSKDNGIPSGHKERAVDAGGQPRGVGSQNANGIVLEPTGSPFLKRKRRSSALNNQSNGDPMQIEIHSNAQNLQEDGDAWPSEAISPTIEELPLPSTLSIGESIGVQSEKVTELASDAVVVLLDDQEASILHTTWSSTSPTCLLATGRSLASLYSVPGSLGPDTVLPRTKPISHLCHTDQVTVTAACWGPAGQAIIATLEEQLHQDDDESPPAKVYSIGCPGSDLRLISSLPELVFALRWNSSSGRLLGVCSNDIRGSIWVWESDKDESLCVQVIEDVVTDAAWITDSVFAVCGHGFLAVFELENGLKIIKSYQRDARWEKLRYDGISDTIACISLEESILGIVSSRDTEMQTSALTDKNLTALEFQPLPDRSHLGTTVARLLATACDNGTVQVWDAGRPFECVYRIRMDVPAMAIAFTPDGSFLAAAGQDIVLIWSAGTGGLPKAFWRGAKDQWATLGLGDEEDGEPEHSLSWDADGKKVAFALGNQIAVISFRR